MIKEEGLCAAVGLDGYALLEAIDAEDAPAWLRKVPAVKTLRRIWVQQYYRSCEGMRWRKGRSVADGCDHKTSSGRRENRVY
jgi:hypothetical protein